MEFYLVVMFKPVIWKLLVGLFQHMNYFDNKTFELGTIAFGPGNNF